MPKVEIGKKCLTLHTKRKILSDLTNSTRNDICSQYSISPSTLSKITKKGNQIRSFHGNAKVRKNLVPEKIKIQDEVLLQWILGLRERGIPVSGVFIQNKAQMLFPNDTRTFSRGWLSRFLKRINHSKKRICEEELSKVDGWKKSLLFTKLPGYSSDNVFNCDESALVYKKLPNKTYHLKGQKCSGGKVSKERVTFLACCIRDGLTKLPLLVIGKSKRPRCFKNFSFTQDFQYCSSSKAWMTREIFSEWLTILNSQFVSTDRKVLMLLDNFSGHVLDEEFSNIELLFLPPNSTSKTQPLDAGIINCIKQNYSRKIINYLDSGKNLSDITLANGIEMICKSWKELESATIVNCFNKCLKTE